ncbi:diguanylate cyclase [Tahibacter amnicola]|uniref:diguanylate cyclase n=1 Tax=Tahibacter amnicola TaxID=2976241 RepID=A0ABY6B7V4_9GAMM|nr:diguanylate cyclase [Tahibacter amnicola]UXI66173.1 diguanylate cyclase [Tahibacter amnicola]
MVQSFKARLLIAFLATGLLFVLIGVQVDDRAREFATTALRVAAAIEKKERAVRVQSDLKAVESAQRAYLITGNYSELEKYIALQPDLHRARHELLQLVGETQPELLQTLERQINERLAILAEVLAVYRTAGPADAAALVASGRGAAAMDAVDHTIAELVARSDADFTTLTARMSDVSRELRLSIPASLFACTLFLGAVLFTVFREQKQRITTEAELQDTAQTLASSIAEMRQITHDANQLTELSELLQSCLNLDEAREGLRGKLSTLLPGLGGRLALINASQSTVAIGAHWGQHGLLAESIFLPDDCWAIRRGRPFPAGSHPEGFVCRHVHFPNPDEPDATYVCIPLAAQGEVLGVLTLDAPRLITPAERELALAAASHVGLALANLRLQQTLRTQSIKDPLTGLFNRRYLEASLEREVNGAIRRRSALSVLMVDMDHFKQVNDTHGHEAGDAVLAQLGALLRSACRSEDVVCRYGGEEFAIVLTDATLEAAQRRAEAIRAAVEQMEVEHRGRMLGPFSVSVGVSVFPLNGSTPQDLMRHADAALYQAKRSGRNRVVLAEAEA